MFETGYWSFLGGFVEKVFSFNEEYILEDALAILSSDNIRLRCMKVAADGEVTDADEAFSKLYDQTKKLFVAQVRVLSFTIWIGYSSDIFAHLGSENQNN